jgi:pyruvate dehydrogenase E2 component (dihydrolipoamide acetyltransferase)
VVCRDADQNLCGKFPQKSVRWLPGGGKVKPDDIEGSTFQPATWVCSTWKSSSPLLIHRKPILAIGSVREVPVVEKGEIKPGMRMKATISVDHRVSDGAEAARFMQAMAKYLEEPLNLVI